RSSASRHHCHRPRLVCHACWVSVRSARWPFHPRDRGQRPHLPHRPPSPLRRSPPERLLLWRHWGGTGAPEWGCVWATGSETYRPEGEGAFSYFFFFFLSQRPLGGTGL